MPGIARLFLHFIDDKVAFAIQIDIHCTAAPVKDLMDLFVAVYVLTYDSFLLFHIFPPFLRGDSAPYFYMFLQKTKKLINFLHSFEQRMQDFSAYLIFYTVKNCLISVRCV